MSALAELVLEWQQARLRLCQADSWKQPDLVPAAVARLANAEAALAAAKPEARPLEALIAEIEGLELRVNNLFHLSNTREQPRWRANLTDDEQGWEFGEAEAPAEALQAAIHKLATSVPERHYRWTGQLPDGQQMAEASAEELGL